jgi:hypothetical protein
MGKAKTTKTAIKIANCVKNAGCLTKCVTVAAFYHSQGEKLSVFGHWAAASRFYYVDKHG